MSATRFIDNGYVDSDFYSRDRSTSRNLEVFECVWSNRQKTAEKTSS